MIADLKPYSEYKDTGLPWLGQVPKHWRKRRMKFLFKERVQKGFPDEPLLAATQSKGVVRKEDYGARTVTAMKDLHLLKLVEGGDFVISLRSFQGGIEVTHARGIISPAYTILEPRTEACRSYYARFFKSAAFISSLTLFVTGIREGQNIDYERLSRAYVPLPPAEEQEAIGRFLDWANGRLERAIRAKRKVIALLNEQKQAIIHRAVTRGLDPAVPLKPSGIPWLGDIPQHWDVKKLRFLFRYAKGGRAAELTKEYIGGNPGPFPVYSGQTEAAGLMGNISWHEFEFPAPVVFVSTVGARAMTTRLVRGKFSLSQNCALIIPRKDDVVVAFFESVFQRLFAFERASISLIMQPSLRFADLNRFYVPHPPHAEQAAIVTVLTQQVAARDSAIARLEREIELLREYRTRLVADVVTGKLDVREASARLPAQAPPDTAEDDVEADDDEPTADDPDEAEP